MHGPTPSHTHPTSRVQALVRGGFGGTLARVYTTAAVLTVLASTTAGVCHGAPCQVDPELPGTASSAASTTARIEYLESRLARGAHNSRAWALGWGVGFGVLAVGQVAIAPFAPADERPDWWVGAGASAVGVLTRAVFRPRIFRERRALANDRSTECQRVAALEGAVVRSARWERQGRGLLMHGLNLGFNTGVGLLLGLVFDRPLAGNRLGALGAVIGEVMIITQPTYFMRTADEYPAAASTARQWSTRPWVAGRAGGLAVLGRM